MGLYSAAQSGNVAEVKRILSQGASPDSDSNGQWTPLHVAINVGQLDVVKVLCESGADISRKVDNHDALMLAKSRKHSGIASYLESYRSNASVSSVAAGLGGLHISYRIPSQSVRVDYGKKLGEGGFGVVYQGEYEYTTAAIKQLHSEGLSQEALKELQYEVELMVRLRSPHIIQVFGACLDEMPYRLVMEYAPRGSLYNVLHQQELSWPEQHRVAIGISQGLHYLHNRQIIHRDLKSLNVLMMEGLQPKITDFGLAKIKTETSSRSTTHRNVVGSLLWMAPELNLDEKPKYNVATDVFSLAMVFWELLSRELPLLNSHNAQAASVKIMMGKRPGIPTSAPKFFATLIGQCWAQSAADRPTLVSVIETMRSNLPSGVVVSPQLVSPSPSSSSGLSTLGGGSSVGYRSAGPAASAGDSLSSLGSLDAYRSVAPVPLKSSGNDGSSQAGLLKSKSQEVAGVAGGMQTDVERVLRLVAEGEQDQAEAMLKEQSVLVQYKGRVTDLSGRTFKAITVFQYAVWALDAHMWTMILKYLPDYDAASQLNDLRGYGTEHGAHADWRPLIKALSNHAQGVDRWLDVDKKLPAGQRKFYKDEADYNAKNEAHWCKTVGVHQRNLPAHVVNEYCRKDRSFHPTPKFDEAQLPRTRETDKGGWFVATYNAGGIGVGWGVYRSAGPGSMCGSSFTTSALYSLTTGILALQAMYNKRVEQLKSLEARLTTFHFYPNQSRAYGNLSTLEGGSSAGYRSVGQGASAGDSLSSLGSSDAFRSMAAAPARPSDRGRPSQAGMLKSKPQQVPGGVQVKQSEVEKVLRLVAEGEQDQAEGMLKQQRALALCKGRVTDLSGRTFKEITVFQYAAWALDAHMWTMILKYLPGPDAAAQLNDLKHHRTEHGAHADWRPLIKALGDHVELMNRWWDVDKKLPAGQRKYYKDEADYYAKNEAHWCKTVGGHQKHLPAHVINEYCRQDRSFDPTPKFDEATLPRTRQTSDGEWYTAKYKGGRLGDRWGALRVGWSDMFAVCAGDPLLLSPYHRTCLPRLLPTDRQALQGLYSKRVEQLEQLEARLTNSHSNTRGAARP